MGGVSQFFYNQLDTLYPEGSLYITTSKADVCPLEALGIGKWQKINSGYTLQQANPDQNPGTYIAAGLPDIQGGFGFDGNQTSPTNEGLLWKSSGAFSITSSNLSTRGLYKSSATGACKDTMTFYASSFNSIYGKSDTVQPPALTVNIWQRIS